MTEKRVISSLLLYYFKFVCPILLLFLSAGAIRAAMELVVPWSVMVALTGLGLGASVYCFVVKKVAMDGKNLYVTGGLRTKASPLDRITKVEQTGSPQRRVTVCYRDHLLQSQSIWFFPKEHLNWGEHPIVRELQEKAGIFNSV